MPKTYILDKAFKVGILYRSEPDKYYVIEKAGTDSTTMAQLKVAGAVCLELLDKIARLQLRDVERFPPLDLGPFFCVIPRDKPFEVTGEAAKYIRAVGRILELSPGEVEATRDLARFGEQARKLLSYQEGINGIGESASWEADEEYIIVNYTCPAGERHSFKQFACVERTGVAAAKLVGALSLIFKVNDAPLDVIDPTLAPLGIDTLRGHYYADTTDFFTPFSLAEMPVELTPGKNLKVVARNISGAAITTAVGEEAKVRVTAVDEKELL